MAANVGRLFYVEKVPRNQGVITMLENEIRMFWENHIIPMTPPSKDPNDDYLGFDF